MKPHEDEWAIDEEAVRDGDYTAVDREGFSVLTAYVRGDIESSDETGEMRIRLAAAAPDMARVLLRVGYGCMVQDPEPGCQCTPCQVRAALTKAGVLP
jgi:hypothetical protein